MTCKMSKCLFPARSNGYCPNHQWMIAKDDGDIKGELTSSIPAPNLSPKEEERVAVYQKQVDPQKVEVIKTRETVADTLDRYAAAPLAWDYVDLSEVSVNLTNYPRWIWLEDALSKLPEGQGIKINVPPDQTANRLQSTIRAALMNARKCTHIRFSIRRSIDAKYLVLTRDGIYPEVTARYERERQIMEGKPNEQA